jgi:riboflavin synthase
VDGIGEVLSRATTARAEHFVLRAPENLSRYLAFKGSIAVDGISLTLNAVTGNQFDLTIVPHTLAHTTMADYQPGTAVNLEVDLIARYLERLQGEVLH